MIRTVKSLCYMSGMAAKTCKGMSEWTKAILVSRQGDPMSPQLFVVILEKIMENMEVQEQSGVIIQEKIIKDLRFADDIDLLAEDVDQLLVQLTELYKTHKLLDFGLHMNRLKTKVMVMR